MSNDKWHWFQHLPESGDPDLFRRLSKAHLDLMAKREALKVAEAIVEDLEGQIETRARIDWTEEEIKQAKRKVGSIPQRRFMYTITNGRGSAHGMYEEGEKLGKPFWRLIKARLDYQPWVTIHGNRKKPVWGLVPRLDAPPSTGTWVEMPTNKE